jgi:xylan 1,4-beta-xylosidase
LSRGHEHGTGTAVNDPVAVQALARDARADWERRIHRHLPATATADPASVLPAPRHVRARAGCGHVLLSWTEVPGAAGYLIERTDGQGVPPHILAHGGSDVSAVPGCDFADTGLRADLTYAYRIGAVAGAEYPVWNWSAAVSSRISVQQAPPVRVAVDAARVSGQLDRVWQMVGSERLTQLTFGEDPTGHHIGREFAEALRMAHDDLGVRYVRAHSILDDANAVVTQDEDGSFVYDFTLVDRLYDAILQLGVRPIVELSFMPAALAADPTQTVFTYRGIVSPPKDWAQWRALVGVFAGHLVERYGIDEVAQWGFEVWNEPNLGVFWTGSKQDYLRLYDESASAVKGVDERLRVGGPSTAAGEWVESLAAYAQDRGLPLDFVTSHTYGNMPLDVRPVLQRHGFEKAPIWWTEWGVGATHFGSIHDGVSGAPFVLSGFAAAQQRIDALAYWVVSDHFEELGRPPRLFHNGFGLLTVGNLRKPRYWAVHLAAHLGDDVLAHDVRGDGANVLIEALATRHDDATVDVLVWNGTINAALMDGDPRLDRRISLSVDGLPPDTYRVELARIDHDHSNILKRAPRGVDWPDEEQFAELRAHDVLHTEDMPQLTPVEGTGRLEFDLPMPGVVRVRLTPVEPGANEESAR